MKVRIDQILPNPKQPRRNFNPDSLMGLAESIREHGLIQPIVVEETKGGYVLVTGERRLRAHGVLGRKTIEAVVRGRTNHNGMEMLMSAIIENVQREDMDPIETAQAYAGLRDDYGMKPEEITRKTGKHSTQIYNALKLLEADPEIQELWAQHAVTHEPKVVDAILSVARGAQRVQLIQELASRRATGRMIISACARFNALKKTKGGKSTKAIDTARSIGAKRPEWDALYQLGKVPPWPVLNETVAETCERCALRPQASEAICGSCGMVSMLQGLLEIVDGA